MSLAYSVQSPSGALLLHDALPYAISICSPKSNSPKLTFVLLFVSLSSQRKCNPIMPIVSGFSLDNLELFITGFH